MDLSARLPLISHDPHHILSQSAFTLAIMINDIMPPDPSQYKKDYRLCLCSSSDCKSRKWEGTDGSINDGKWCHRSTQTKHYAKDAQQRLADCRECRPKISTYALDYPTDYPTAVKATSGSAKGKSSRAGDPTMTTVRAFDLVTPLTRVTAW